jgi:cystathionine gamma-lyase
VRGVASERLAPRGVDVRLVPTDTEAIVAACPGARMVWIETPSNPALDVCDIAAVAAAAHAAGARLVVDNTLATPLGQRPLEHGADAVHYSATKALSGHSDIVLGAAATRDPEWAADLRHQRSRGGAIAGPFEAWLLQRSLPTLALRLTRQSENALALARFLGDAGGVADVRHPGLEQHPGHAVARRQMLLYGPLVGFTLDGADRAQRFLGALELVAEATSFGGVHSTAERRARWETDDVAPGFIRFSAGCEDVADLIADVEQALAAS